MARKRGSETIETPQWIVKKRSVTRTKYNVEKETAKRTYKGVVYDSAMEMRYFVEVVEPLIAQGVVESYERQKPYVLQDGFERYGKKVFPIKYIADYYIKYSNGLEEVIDIKGNPDTVALLKRKLFWGKYPEINYRWLTYNKSHGGWVDYDDLQAQKKLEKKEKKKTKKLEEEI